MVSKLPRSLPRLSLSEDEIFWPTDKIDTAGTDGEAITEHNVERKSILAPLRKRVGGGSGDVCTAEAAVSVLGAVGLSMSDCDKVLSVVRRKVDSTARFRGLIPQRDEAKTGL